MQKKDQSNRQLKVANLIKHELINVLQRGKQLDKRLIDNRLTITNVKVSPDLKLASCYFLPFGNNDEASNQLLEALEASKYAIRKQITETVNLKFSPELRFFFDYGVVHASEVEAVMLKLRKTDSSQ